MDQGHSVLTKVAFVLEELGLVSYLQNFQENCLTDEIVTELSFKELEDVVKPVGHRKIFQQKFKSLYQDQSSYNKKNGSSQPNSEENNPTTENNQDLTLSQQNINNQTSLNTDNYVTAEYERYTEFKHSSSKMYSKWSTLASKILLYAQQNNIDITEKLSLETNLLDEMTEDTPSFGSLTGEKCELAAFAILPFVFNSGYVVKESKRRKVSNSTSLKHLLQILPVGTNLSDFAEKENVRTQPFIFLLGNRSSMDIEQHFVIAERKLIPCNSVTQAVDCCFKTHKVLNAKWATEVSAVWNFLESYVYELEAVKSSQECFITFLK